MLVEGAEELVDTDGDIAGAKRFRGSNGLAARNYTPRRLF